MFIYTNKDLVDVLPLREREFKDCGIDDKNIIQIHSKDSIHSFMEVLDVELFNKIKLDELTIQTEDERNNLINILQQEYVKLMEQHQRNTVEYKIEQIDNKLNTLIDLYTNIQSTLEKQLGV